MISARKLQRALVQLEPHRFSYLLVGFLKKQSKEEQEELTPGTILKLALFDWMSHLGFLDVSQQERIVTRFDEYLERTGVHNDTGDAGVMYFAGHMLSISDGRYVTLSKWPTVMYDLKTGADVQAMDEPAVTHVSCDMSSLRVRLQARLDALEGSDGADRKSTT